MDAKLVSGRGQRRQDGAVMLGNEGWAAVDARHLVIHAQEPREAGRPAGGRHQTLAELACVRRPGFKTQPRIAIVKSRPRVVGLRVDREHEGHPRTVAHDVPSATPVSHDSYASAIESQA